MDRRQLTAWLKEYKKAWETQDTAIFVSLFTDECEYRCTPFTEPVLRRDFRAFWHALAQEQQDNQIEFEILAEPVASRAIVNWRASSTRKRTGKRHNTDGILLLTFSHAGRCSDLREWWHLHPLGAPLESWASHIHP